MGFRLIVRTLLVIMILAVGIAGGLSTARRSLENRFVIENRSGAAIASLRVSIAGETYAFASIPDGATVGAAFPIRGDDHFLLSGTLADGTRFAGDFGYVTSGLYGVRAEFVLRPGGRVDFRQIG